MSRVKPILFNTEMVRAILDGRKTVTRRICKDGNAYTVPDMSFYDADRRTYAVHNYANLKHTEKLSLAERTCPICPGDILYVRETFAYDRDKGEYLYKASPKTYGHIGTYDDIIWHPSIHMPKEAARIWLKVTESGWSGCRILPRNKHVWKAFLCGMMLAMQTTDGFQHYMTRTVVENRI